MFCLFCVEYNGLDKPCNKGITVTNIQDIMECPDYKYNGDLNES